MQIAIVIGAVVASIKDPRLSGLKLMLVREPGRSGRDETGGAYVAVDLVGAGDGETVIVTRGTPASGASDAWTQRMPIDAAIVGIVDSNQGEAIQKALTRAPKPGG